MAFSEEPKGIKSSKSYSEGDNLLVSFVKPQQKCGKACCSNGCFALQRVKSSPEQGVPCTQVTKSITLPASLDKFHPTGLNLLSVEWFPLSSTVQVQALGVMWQGQVLWYILFQFIHHCRNFAANLSYKRQHNFSMFSLLPCSGKPPISVPVVTS